MSCAALPLDACAELCFHALAHVPLADPGSSYDPRYLAWAAGFGLADAGRRADGDLVARSIGTRARPLLHHWIAVWRDLEQLAASCTRALVELGSADVADPALLASIHATGDAALEVFHTSIALDLDAWRALHRDVVAPAMDRATSVVAPMLVSVAQRVPTLQSQTIALSWVLGPRGRGHPTRLVVGAPAAWHDGTPEQSVVIALHEHAVRDLARGDWASVEWSALCRVADWVAAWPELRRAHERWVARLDLGSLSDTLRRRDVIDQTTADALVGSERWTTLREHGAALHDG